MPRGIGRLLAVKGTTVSVAIAVVFAIALVELAGWLAVGLLGLLVLVASFWLDMLGGRAFSDLSPGGEAVNLLAQQLAEEARASPEQKLAAAAAREERKRLHRTVRSIGLALAAVGFGLALLI